ncbi:MAG: hypothetical protein AAF830_13395 [Pseudomonadota bacterium]
MALILRWFMRASMNRTGRKAPHALSENGGTLRWSKSAMRANIAGIAFFIALGVVSTLWGVYELLNGIPAWLAVYFGALGVAFFGFAVIFIGPTRAALRGDLDFVWNEAGASGPSRETRFGGMLRTPREMIAWSDVRVLGETPCNKFLEAHDGRRVYWFQQYRGWAHFEEIVLQKVPTVRREPLQ